MNVRTALALLLVATLACGAVAATAAGVPDARLTVDEIEVTPADPDPEEPVTVTATVASSVGSDAAVEIDRVALRDRDDDSIATATDPGSLSPGDDLTVDLATSFETPGVHDLAVVVNGTDENNESVSVRRPVRVVVGGVDVGAAGVDADVDGREARTEPMETSNDDLGLDLDGLDVGGDLEGDGEAEPEPAADEAISVEVANLGAFPLRNVVVEPDADALPRRPIADVAPGETEAVRFDAGRLDPGTELSVTVAYDAAGTRFDETATYRYEPPASELAVTDVDVVRVGDEIEISGNVANVGQADAAGAVVAVEETDHVRPIYPGRSYFVGAVPESDFVAFELTADVDHENATTIPVRLTYQDGGIERERVVDLPYEPRSDDGSDDDGRPLLLYAGGLVGMVVLFGGGAAVWRQRND